MPFPKMLESVETELAIEEVEGGGEGNVDGRGTKN